MFRTEHTFLVETRKKGEKVKIIMEKLIEKFDGIEYRARHFSYFSRIISFFKSSLVFYILIVVVGGMLATYLSAILGLSFFLLFNIFEYSNWARYYLTHIERIEGKLTVEYYDRNSACIVVDDISSFSIKAKRLWYKVRSDAPYLEITHNGSLILRQFLMKDVDENIIKRIESNFDRA